MSRNWKHLEVFGSDESAQNGTVCLFSAAFSIGAEMVAQTVCGGRAAHSKGKECAEWKSVRQMQRVAKVRAKCTETDEP